MSALASGERRHNMHTRNRCFPPARPALNRAPFDRWALRDQTAQRRFRTEMSLMANHAMHSDGNFAARHFRR